MSRIRNTDRSLFVILLYISLKYYVKLDSFPFPAIGSLYRVLYSLFPCFIAFYVAINKFRSVYFFCLFFFLQLLTYGTCRNVFFINVTKYQLLWADRGRRSQMSIFCHKRWVQHAMSRKWWQSFQVTASTISVTLAPLLAFNFGPVE